jgi:hypothetical protein
MIIGLPFRTTCANSGQLFTFHSRAESHRTPCARSALLCSAQRIAPTHYRDSMHRWHRCFGTIRAAPQHEAAH